MEPYIETVTNYIQTYDWNNPFTFVIVVITGLVILKKWDALLLIIATIGLGLVAQGLIIYNLRTASEVIGLPVIIYCTGGILLIIFAVISYFKFSIS